MCAWNETEKHEFEHGFRERQELVEVIAASRTWSGTQQSECRVKLARLRQIRSMGQLQTTPVHSLTLREFLRHSPTSWPRVTNIANATGLTCRLLLTIQLCTPHAIIARRYGWIGGASENHQRDRDREASRAKTHAVSYRIRFTAETKAPAAYYRGFPRVWLSLSNRESAAGESKS
jgi:hypothetical protein